MSLLSMEHASRAVRKTAAATTSGVGLDELDWRQCRECLAGDGNACADLFKRHEPEIARHMWRFSRDRATQAELVQEVFVQAYLSLHRYRPRKVPLEHWLVRIATRVGYQFWKQQARRRTLQPLENLDLPAAPSPDPGDAAAAAEILHNLLAHLPTTDRLVLTLMYFDECTIRQISDRTGWNPAMVKMRAYRARNRLRRIIVQKNMTETLLGIGHGTT